MAQTKPSCSTKTRICRTKTAAQPSAGSRSARSIRAKRLPLVGGRPARQDSYKTSHFDQRRLKKRHQSQHLAGFRQIAGFHRHVFCPFGPKVPICRPEEQRITKKNDVAESAPILPTPILVAACHGFTLWRESRRFLRWLIAEQRCDTDFQSVEMLIRCTSTPASPRRLPCPSSCISRPAEPSWP